MTFKENKNNEEFYIVYVKYYGTELNGDYLYRLYFSTNPEETFAEGWSETPACNVKDKLMDIDESQYQKVLELKSNIILDLARECCCFSMQDCRDHILALAFENIDNAEEYPEPRIIIQYGDKINDIEVLFAKRNIVLKQIE